MDGSPRPRTRAASVTVHLLASCAVGLFVWLVSGRAGFVNYDAAWSLDWMRELVAGGSRPDLTRLFSPTPHPLSDLFSALLVPLSDAGGPAVGRAAETVLVVLAMFWLGALGVVTFRLGAAWFGPAAGVVAAVLVLTREPVLSYGLRTYLDLPYAVFLLLALLAETRRPRNGARTIAWITLAGLLRPEAWLLAAAYVAYLVVWQVRGDAGAAADGPAGSAAAEGGPAVVPTPVDGGPTVATTPADGGPTVATPAAGATARPDDTTPVPHGRSGIRRDPVESQSVPAKGARRRVPRVAIRPLLPLVALSLIAPLGWLIEGLVLTGDPLQALTGTQQNAADLDRVTGLSSAVTVMPRRLGEIVREPVLLAALGGVLLSLAFLRRRAMLGVGAAIAAGLGFFALAVAGLPLLTRYLVFPATLIIVFAAAGLLGWRHLAPGHRWRRPWQAFAVVAALAFLVFLPSQVDRLDRLGNALALQGRVIDDLRTVTGGVVRPVLEGTGACPARGRGDVDVALPNHRAIPQVLLWMGRPGDGDETGTGEDERAPGAEPYPSVGAIGTRVRSRALRSRVVLLPSSERVARGFILDRADNGRGLPAAPAGSVRAGTLGTWTVYGADRACASALRARLAG